MKEIKIDKTDDLKEKDALLWATIAGIEKTQKKYPNLHFFIAAYNSDTELSAAKAVTSFDASGQPSSFESLTKLCVASLGSLSQLMQVDISKLVAREIERIVKNDK